MFNETIKSADFCVVLCGIPLSLSISHKLCKLNQCFLAFYHTSNLNHIFGHISNIFTMHYYLHHQDSSINLLIKILSETIIFNQQELKSTRANTKDYSYTFLQKYLWLLRDIHSCFQLTQLITITIVSTK